MSKIKSERAKDCFNVRRIAYINFFGRPVAEQITEAIETIVITAEQDAEERAVKAANLLYEELEPIFLHPMKREWIIDKFKAFYNDGGQSDEQ